MNSAVQDAMAISPSKRIGVVATEATVNNEMHKISAAQIDQRLSCMPEGLSCFCAVN